MVYSEFAEASPGSSNPYAQKTNGSGGGGDKPTVQVPSDIQIFRISLIVMPGEGPTQIARRLQQKLGGLPVSWLSVVVQNKQYFSGITNITDITSPEFNANTELKPGSIIRYQALYIRAAYNPSVDSEHLLGMVNPVTQDTVKLGVEGNVDVNGTIEVIFGVYEDGVEAYLGIGLELSAGTKFIIDDKGITEESQEPKIAFFVEGVGSAKIGRLETAVTLKGSYEHTTKEFKVEFDR